MQINGYAFDCVRKAKFTLGRYYCTRELVAYSHHNQHRVGSYQKYPRFCYLLVRLHKFHLSHARNMLLQLAVQCSMSSMYDIKICMPSPKFDNFTITALNVEVIIKLTISDVSKNESALETCISSEPESLSSSKC